MKIDGNRPTQNTEANEASTRTVADRRVQRSGVDRSSGDARVPASASTKADRVEVSSDARLMTSALTAAHDAPAIRTELVERLRQKLNAGEVGQDSGKLADRLIDDLLNR
jgi:flagellar biosynthesis anti-sigma factor FlgM